MTNTWEVYNSKMYVSNDNELFVESHILFGRVSDVKLAGEYTNSSLLGLELDHWINQVHREEVMHLLFADSSKYLANPGLTLKRWAQTMSPY